jgi:hypothetical protein
MELEVGKSYKTRSGVKVKIVYIHDDDPDIKDCAVGVFKEGDPKLFNDKSRLFTWHKNGKYLEGQKSSRLDLVEEWLEKEVVEGWALYDTTYKSLGEIKTLGEAQKKKLFIEGLESESAIELDRYRFVKVKHTLIDGDLVSIEVLDDKEN